ncbi:hypothetical protein IW140_002946 [Coemansia sp. RSA 1813]|nr:hypothetical protein EV178_002866 [Coemansia sp. RSA 1646]KAJ1771950.1 hypothetical protein LPJ74_001842 [Coemansia sp. RSA 1843]KAJ2089721.1 hypothetical protein IW138_003177 [Coemansia sp. RSA 986]KAJ2214275.1 hypothetical protein EV179_003177 [Coemansia sp. RSA 487]KAJ2569692.1 hypothetical protein IW140_002946 [Coemansia sp. RSA 1813]
MSLQVQPVARRITAVAWLPPRAGNAYNDADLHFVTGSGGKHRELVLWTTVNPDFDNDTEGAQDSADERPLASLIAKVAHDGDIHGIAALSDIVATVSSFGTISIYQADHGHSDDTSRLALRESITAHRFANSERASGTALAMQPVDSPDAEVASCGEDGCIAYAQVSRLDALQQHEVDSTVITGICWPTPAQTAISTRGGQVKLFDRRTPADVSAVFVSPSTSYAFECIAAHPSQSFRLATGTDSGAVLLWDTRNLKSPAMEVFNVHGSNVWDVQFDPTNSGRIVSCSDDATLAVTQWSTDGADASSSARDVRRVSSFFNVLSVNCLDVCPFTRSSIIVAGSDSGNLLIEKSTNDDDFQLF